MIALDFSELWVGLARTLRLPDLLPDQIFIGGILAPGAGANLKRALKAAAPNSQQPARDAVVEDFYAPSSRAPRVSRRGTWCAIAQEWGIPPLPLTRELVVAIGSSMKTGGYRSAEQYFSQAKQEH